MKKDSDIEKLLFENLNTIIEYTRGSKNLEEAKENLKKSGFTDSVIEKVLKNIQRKNVIKLPQND